MTEQVEKALDAILPAVDARPTELSQAMRWAVMGGGKRIRPQICLMASVAAGGDVRDAVSPACAIELLHSYTLVHDDLPAMDNDAERRGRPSVWAKFGEANAILAGDALQALAFRTASCSPRNAVAITASLSRAATAVVEGQVEDLRGAEAANQDVLRGAEAVNQDVLRGAEAVKLVEDVFARKTAALFAAAAEMGALAAGGDEAVVAKLSSYGRNLGMAFQYEDDLLDGADGAFSSLSVLGRDEVERRIAAHTSAAKSALDGLPGDTSPLVELAAGLVSRTM